MRRSAIMIAHLLYLNKKLNIEKTISGKDGASDATYSNIGNIYLHKGDTEQALLYYKKALAIGKDNYGDNNLQAAKYYANVGQAYSHKGNHKRTLENSLKANIIFEQLISEGHPYFAIMFTIIGNTYSRLEEHAEH